MKIKRGDFFFPKSENERTKDRETGPNLKAVYIVKNQEIWKNKNLLLLKNGPDTLRKKWSVHF